MTEKLPDEIYAIAHPWSEWADTEEHAKHKSEVNCCDAPFAKYVRADTRALSCPDGLECSGDGRDCVGDARCATPDKLQEAIEKATRYNRRECFADNIDGMNANIEFYQLLQIAKQTATLQRQLDEARRVMAFYADKEVYKAQDAYCPSRGDYQRVKEIVIDNGHRAREWMERNK